MKSIRRERVFGPGWAVPLDRNAKARIAARAWSARNRPAGPTIAEVKRDQRQRGRLLGGKAPWGYAVGRGGELVPIPDQQSAIRRMRKLRDQGLPLRTISAKKAAGVSISHAGVKNALDAAREAV